MKKNKSSARSILDSKPLWMLLSLLISLSIWTYVVSTETATVTQVFRGIPVEITGDDLLLSRQARCRRRCFDGQDQGRRAP